MSTYYTVRTDEGIKVCFAVTQSNGTLRTALVAGDFTVTVVNPADSTTLTPTVSESSSKPGLYCFTITSAFLGTNGVGVYAFVVEVNTFAGPSSAPHVRDAIPGNVRATQEDIDSIADGLAGTFDRSTDTLEDLANTSGVDWSTSEREQIRDALGVTGTKTTATGGQLQTKAEPGDSMDLVADAVDSTSLATSATNEIRDAILLNILEGNTLGLTLAAQVNLFRKLLNNRLELDDGGSGDANWVLFDDDDATVLETFDVTDKTGSDIAIVANTPARRTRGT